MGLFDFFKKKETKETPKPEKENSSLALSMPIFKGGSYSLDKVLEDLKSHWGLEISEISGDDEVATLTINGMMAAIAKMPAPIPSRDLESIFGYSYLWNNVEKEVSEHDSHAIVSILDKSKSQVEKFSLMTMINASILRTSPDAIGVYQGSQTLLLPKGLYIDFADFLLEGNLPVILWIYIGLVGSEEGKNSLYTFGMKDFGKEEIEIIDSQMSRGDLHEFILPVLNYILAYDVTLKNGETIGFSEEQKIKITESKAVYLDGNSLKLEL